MPDEAILACAESLHQFQGDRLTDAIRHKSVLLVDEIFHRLRFDDPWTNDSPIWQRIVQQRILMVTDDSGDVKGRLTRLLELDDATEVQRLSALHLCSMDATVMVEPACIGLAWVTHPVLAYDHYHLPASGRGAGWRRRLRFGFRSVGRRQSDGRWRKIAPGSDDTAPFPIRFRSLLNVSCA